MRSSSKKAPLEQYLFLWFCSYEMSLGTIVPLKLLKNCNATTTNFFHRLHIIFINFKMSSRPWLNGKAYSSSE